MSDVKTEVGVNWGLVKRHYDHPGGGELMTKQAGAEDCDVNLIVKMYGQNGSLQHVNPREPMYGDFTGPKDYFEARAYLEQVDKDFAELPSAVREIAQNDPMTYLEMLADEGGFQALKAAGMPVKETPKNEGETPPNVG